MPVILKTAFDVLTSKPVALLAEAAVVVLVIALLGAKMETAAQGRLLTASQNTVGQLKGSLEFQNMAVEDLGKKSAEAAARAQGAIAAAGAAHAGDGALVAALLSKATQTDPALACKAADDAILENIK